MFFAIVFRRDFKKGEHWTDHLPLPRRGQLHVHGKHRVGDDDPDRKQHWRAGDLYSTGTVLGPLPEHLEAIEFPEPPPDGWIWSIESRAFVSPESMVD